MLQFKGVFHKGQWLHIEDMPTVMLCENIDFGHVSWPCDIRMYSDTNLMIHIINNIIDINARDNDSTHNFTFFNKIMNYSTNQSIIQYLLNNRCITTELFDSPNFRVSHIPYEYSRTLYTQSHNLVKYLTMISIDKFKGYCNLEKYYNMLPIMVLVTKAQKKLPSSVIKHLIIPFIYQ